MAKDETKTDDTENRLLQANELLSQEIEALKAVIQSLQDDNTQMAENAERKVTALEAKLRASKSAPVGDVVFLDGQTHAVLTTVRADNTFSEVKRGHVAEGSTLVVIAKQH